MTYAQATWMLLAFDPQQAFAGTTRLGALVDRRRRPETRVDRQLSMPPRGFLTRTRTRSCA